MLLPGAGVDWLPTLVLLASDSCSNILKSLAAIRISVFLHTTTDAAPGRPLRNFSTVATFKIGTCTVCLNACRNSQMLSLSSCMEGRDALHLTLRPLKRMPNTIALLCSFSFRIVTVSSFRCRVIAFATWEPSQTLLDKSTLDEKNSEKFIPTFRHLLRLQRGGNALGRRAAPL